jgi:hypothetical protein
MRRLLAIVALVTLAACDSFDPLIDNTVAGTWRGTSAGETFVVTLQQSGSVVAGNGTITSTAAGQRQLSISGTYTEPSFGATFTPNGAQSITYIANVQRATTMTGALTGGGFNGEALSLTRDQ